MPDKKKRKEILIVSFSPDDWEGYRTILEGLFGDGIFKLKFAAISEPSVPRCRADLVLVAYEELKKYALSKADGCVPVITINHTLEKDQVNQLKEVSRHSRMSVASDTMYYSENRKNMLVAMGFPSQCLRTWCPEMGEERLEEHVILFEGTQILDREQRKIYEVRTRGRGLIASDTVVQILFALERMELLGRASVRQYFQRVQPVMSCSIEELDGRDYYTYLHDSNNRRGYLLFSCQNEVYYCDINARFLIGKRTEEIIGSPIFELFPFLAEYRNKLDSFGERVISYGGRSLIVDLWRYKTHGVYSGYIVISDYAAETQKELRLRRQMISKKHTAKYSFSSIKGRSQAIANCLRIARRVAGSDAGVLITGPTGAGKELFAQSIHNASARQAQPFISVNCGALVDSLLESELFGYEAGAFTGAKKEGHMGLFELAHNGTLFLDEVGDMPLSLQVKLLRVLQEKEVVRVGGHSVIPINVRVIAATNKDLRQLVHQGKFRMDLYYRLNILPLEIPGLNQRREDIMDLFHEMQQKFHYTFSLDERAREAIICHNYEGNVRELQNVVEYLGSLGQAEITREDLPAYLDDRESQMMEHNLLQEEHCVVEAVKRINQAGVGAGRRSVRAALQEQGILYGEGRIRNIVLELQKKGYVEIRGGRGGIWLRQGIQMGE